jgi:hypothetical protein
VISLLLLAAAQAAVPVAPSPPDVVIVKDKNRNCNLVEATGSRLRTIRRCGDMASDPQARIDQLEADRAVKYLSDQGRLNAASRAR